MPSKLRIALASVLAIAALGAIAPAANAYVYWANSGSGTIGRANLDGTGVDQSFITLTSGLVQDVAVDSNYIYWTNYYGGIGRANLNGSGINESFISDTGGPNGIAVDSNYIYWTTSGTGGGGYGDAIARANLNGTGKDVNFISGLVAASTRATDVAVDSSSIYIASFNSNVISRANLNGTSLQAIISPVPPTSPIAVALDSSHLFTANYDGDSIGRADLGSGANWNKNFVTGASDPAGVAVDSSHIFWTNQATGSIGKANLNGSSADQSLVTGASTPNGMTVDSLSPAGALTPSTSDYGAVKAQGGEKSLTLTLTSSGNVPLTVEGFSISGADGENFGILGDGTCAVGVTSLSNGQSCTVAVNFGPLSIGSKTALLDIGTNAGVESAVLSGTAVPAPTLVPVRTSKISTKVKIGCGDSSSCSLRLTGKKVGTNAQITPKTVAVGAGKQPVITLAYSPALKRALAKGGRLSVTATRLNATGAAKTITVTVRR